MKKIFYMKDSFFVYKYYLVFNEKRAFNLMNELDKYYGMGDEYTTVVTAENFDNFYKLTSGSGKTIKVVSAKRRKKIKHEAVYEYRFYIFSRSELSSLIFSIFNSKGEFELTFALNSLFNYIPQNDDEKHFILKFLNIINFKDYLPNDFDCSLLDDTKFACIPKISEINDFCSNLTLDSDIYKHVNKNFLN